MLQSYARQKPYLNFLVSIKFYSGLITFINQKEKDSSDDQ
jgi:hypothetical protein